MNNLVVLIKHQLFPTIIEFGVLRGSILAKMKEDCTGLEKAKGGGRAGTAASAGQLLLRPLAATGPRALA